MGKKRRKSKVVPGVSTANASGLYGYHDPKMLPPQGRIPAPSKSLVGRTEAPSLGIGDVVSHEGMTIGHTVVAGYMVNFVATSCSCGGENPNCYKCDGTGYYVVERPGCEVVAHCEGKKKKRKSKKRVASTEASFSNDARGGDYAIRENGRFLSNPLHDDYDDESTS
ncbi:MAG: hypothetical protein Q8M09_18145 [Pseudomonadota bacterium]|nr:hypothetical protein [Pseudomonadota bacterium]MDP1572901.1 hypothetical protein [Pseudomonadota bacterium]MDP1906137.1 hypothetical protein [Pseudomonadota bacterium]